MASTACFLCSRRPAEENVPCPSPKIVHSSFTPDTACVSRCSLDLVAVNAAVRRCDEEIVILRNLLMTHQNTRKQLQERAAQYRSVMSPIRRLPKELLVKIFSHSITDYFRVGRFGDDGLINEPSTLPIFILLSVCSKWRTVILSTGALWAQFQCKVTKAVERGGIGFKCLEMHLERSRDAALSFCIVGDSILPGHPLFRRLLEEKRRWKHVALQCKEIALRGWDLPPHSFPCLSRFEVDSTVILDEDENDVVPQLSFATDRLRFLDVSPTLLGQASFCFDKLTSLVVSHYTASATVARCLFACSSAVYLEYIEFWQGSGDDDEDDFDYKAFHEGGSVRKTLNVKAMTMVVAPESRGVLLKLLSTCFSLPDLHTFKLGKLGDVYRSALNPVLSSTVTFLDEAATNVKSLSIHGLSSSSAQYLRIMRATPLLEELSLTFTERGDIKRTVLEELTVSAFGTIPVLLPLLRAVNFNFDDYEGAKFMGVLIDMVSSRDGSAPSLDVATLENVVVEFTEASRSRDAATLLRSVAPPAYGLRWIDWKSFSLLKEGCKQRWAEVANPSYTSLQQRSYLETTQ
ncbi:hypothetical protein BDZ89DRAFT_1069756 [Hymenopellis radicata]|nr:hypothetical protein BDZ89DRAFT_1069756 [Hymenopellis radicata]